MEKADVFWFRRVSGEIIMFAFDDLDVFSAHVLLILYLFGHRLVANDLYYHYSKQKLMAVAQMTNLGYLDMLRNYLSGTQIGILLHP